MELKSFVEVGLRRWPVVVLAFLFTLGLTFELALSQEPTYRSCGTFVVRPRVTDGDAGARAFDALVRGPEINATYASIARSGAVRKSAEDRLPAGIDPEGVSVSAEVTTGTNTISICASGHDPEAAYSLAAAVGESTVEYIRDLDETYDLVPLDRPVVPASPEPQRTGLTIAIGAFCGLVFGFVLASVLEFIVTTWRAARARRDDAADAPPAPSPAPAAVPPEPAAPAGRPAATIPEPAPPAAGPAAAPGPVPAEPPAPAPPAPDPAAPEARDLVAPSLEPAQRAKVLRLLDRRAQGDQPVGYAMVHARRTSRGGRGETADRANGNGSPGANGTPAPPRDRDGDVTSLERCLREWARGGNGDVLRLDDDAYAVVVPGVTSASASRLLADVAAVISAAELNGEAGEWAFELAIGTYRKQATAGEAGPETAEGDRGLGRRKNGRPAAASKAGFPTGPPK
ncbi:MAG: hypothetical protein KatS3mg009_1886 [Acidimicrobiia bacterium]|nr:MAG: hypothetical protein KatS3mg009_1886 [Acidimicrobiia bacterium]